MLSKGDIYNVWIRWSVTLMKEVEKLIEYMSTRVIYDYTVLHAAPVSLLAWEYMLSFIDAMTGLEEPNMEHLSIGLAYVYIRYETTLSIGISYQLWFGMASY